MAIKSLRKLGSGLGGAVDGAILSALRFRFTRPVSNGQREKDAFAQGGVETDRRVLLQGAIDYYARDDVRRSFFQDPPPVTPSLRVREQLDDDGQLVDLAWPSPFIPHWEATRADYLSWEANRASKVRDRKSVV